MQSLYVSLLRLWAGLYYSVQEGILPESALNSIGAGGDLNSRYFEEIWPDIRLAFDAEYAQFIEGQISKFQNNATAF